MKNVKIYFLFFFLFCTAFSFSQSIDSLRSVLKTQKDNDTSRVNTLIALVTAYQQANNYDESYPYLEEAISIGEKNNFIKGLASLYRRSGDYHEYKSNYALALKEYIASLDNETILGNKHNIAVCQTKIALLYSTTKQYNKAIANYKEGFEIYKQLKDTLGQFDMLAAIWRIQNDQRKDSIASSQVMNQLMGFINGAKNDSVRALVFNKAGLFYLDEGDIELAARYYNDALHIYEDKKKEIDIASSYYNLASVYERIGNYPKALEYYLKVLPLTEKNGTLAQKARANNNVGWGYMLNENHKQAIDYLLRSYKLYLEDRDALNTCFPLGNLGIVYNRTGEYQKAIDYSTLALKLFEKKEDLEGVAESYNNIGTAYFNLNEYDKSLSNLERGLKYAQEYNSAYEVKNAYAGLSRTYNKIGNYKKALDYFTLFTHIKDSIANEENSDHINRLVSSIENEKKNKAFALLMKDAELQETELKKQRIIIYSVIGGIVLSLLLLFFAVRGYARQQKNNLKLLQYNSKISAQKKEIEHMYRNVKLLSKIGQQITSCLSVEKIIDTSYENINQLMDASFFWVGVYDKKSNTLKSPVGIERGKKIINTHGGLSITTDVTRIPVWAFLNQRIAIVNDYLKEYNKYIPSGTPPMPLAGEMPESSIWVPLISKERKGIGILTIQSFHKNAYNEYHINIARNLAVFITIALENAIAYHNKE